MCFSTLQYEIIGVSSMWKVKGNEFFIPGVTKLMINMKVKCSVTNSEGTGADSVNIDVACNMNK